MSMMPGRVGSTYTVRSFSNFEHMKLLDYILFCSALAFFAIGIYETFVLGIGYAYWIFMLSLGLLFLYGYRKNKRAHKN